MHGAESEQLVRLAYSACSFVVSELREIVL